MSLSEAVLVDAATALVEESGFDALTLRSLGTRLGTSGPALYSHFRSKDVLVDRVVDRLLEQAGQQWHPPADWRGMLRSFSQFLRELLVRHEAVLNSVQRSPLSSPATQAIGETVLEALAVGGFDAEGAVHAYYAVWAFTIGSASVEHGRAAVRLATGRVEAEQWARTEHELSEGAGPRMRDAAPYLARMVSQASYTDALEAILDGLATRIPARRGGRR